MIAAFRAWPALFAGGSGLLHLSLGASLAQGMVTMPRTVVLVLLLILGAAELAWAGTSLRAGRPVAPRAAAGASSAGIVLGGAAIIAGASPLAVGASCALVLLGVGLMARSRSRRPARPGGPGRATVATAVGAVLVAALVTPALSTVSVPPDGARGSVSVPDPHGGH
ncbi:hypothetical protein [Microbacterium resistens]|uniref:Uncharacterized protein n=1 Tax=Microbacterium resistens TaxID=156977 RepID=A0ABY3RUS9_9MICO|nr:hypothetical protein [Microbacterium resistens]UGS26644.1 hypothetical protein K8F61_18875 [Microbacterium resistens]